VLTAKRLLHSAIVCVAHIESYRWALLLAHQNKQSECKSALLLGTCSLTAPQRSLDEKSQLRFYNHYSPSWYLSESAECTESVQFKPKLTAAPLRSQSEHTVQGGIFACFVFLCQLLVSYRKTDWTDVTSNDITEVT